MMRNQTKTEEAIINNNFIQFGSIQLNGIINNEGKIKEGATRHAIQYHVMPCHQPWYSASHCQIEIE